MSRNEEFAGGVPPEMGTLPVPDGHIRLFHQTQTSNVEAIRKEGLRADLGGRHGDPPGLWANAGKPFYDHSAGATVEFSVPVSDLTDGASDTRQVREGAVSPEEWSKKASPVLLSRNVSPSQFLAVHEPWHHYVRYFAENGMVDAVKAGEYDDLLDDPDHGPAIRHVKERM